MIRLPHVLLCCLSLIAVIGRSDPAAPPNVLIIVADDLGWADVGYHGREDIKTPQLDALAETGLVFNRAYANSSICSPTRVSLLTGRINSTTGMQGVHRSDQPLNTWGYWNPSIPSLMEDFQNYGYVTAVIGKWHLGTSPPNLPNARGFDHFKGVLSGVVDDNYHHLTRGRNMMRENDRVIETSGHITDLLTQWSIDFIAEHTAQPSTPPPFLLYLSYTAPHTPIQPAPEWLARVEAREPDIDPMRAGYVALVEHMDDGIGQIMAALHERGLAENTIVLFTSDNGGMERYGARNGPYRDGKGTMYEGGLRVPAFMVWPDHIAPGSTTDEITTTMDYLPTLMDLIGIDSDAVVDGRSFAPLFGDAPLPPRELSLFFAKRSGRFRWGGNLSFAVLRDNLKLLQSDPFRPIEMYDLAADPFETHDLLGGTGTAPEDPELHAAYRKIFIEMLYHVQQAGRYPFVGPDTPAPLP
jgi:arylsulfatase A-like enzyme